MLGNRVKFASKSNAKWELLVVTVAAQSDFIAVAHYLKAKLVKYPSVTSV